ncbi:MAG: tRNA (adenosine(37)-N6)-threonylcarbamoyltransferase complex dimerization subunit type 1 TsaB [Acidobacteria bacterium]|nr:tRNA (adenosine(37)-N6)-threonylcarbamoyltransferase complex dimerization subunit type 1 TsaB [Acidobacteriota bacterium]
MRVLAIDTTSDFGSLALLQDRDVVKEIPLHSSDGFGHVLFGQIQRALDDADWGLDSIDCFAAAAGPGSFTGVRVGLAAAKGLADVQQRGLVAVSNLAAIATYGSAPLRAPVIDARRGEVYGAVYDAAGMLVQAETVAPFRDWVASLPGGVELVCATPSLFAPHAGADLRWVECPRSIAAAVARIAAARFGSCMTTDALTADANYVRRSDAELFWKD